MFIITQSFRAVTKKPVVLSIIGLVLFFYCIIEYFMIYPFIESVNSISTGNVYEMIVYGYQLIFSLYTGLENLIFNILSMFIFINIGALVWSIIGNAIKFNNATIIEGVKKYFLKSLKVFTITTFLTLIFIIFNSVATVPGLIVTGISQSNSDMIMLAIFVDMLTLGAIIFNTCIFQVYIISWAINHFQLDERFFEMSRSKISKNFWNLIGKIFSINIIVILVSIILIYLSNVANINGSTLGIVFFIVFLINWSIKTLCLGTLVEYIFSMFKEKEED